MSLKKENGDFIKGTIYNTNTEQTEAFYTEKYVLEIRQEIARLNNIIERLVDYNELVYKRYDKKIKDHTIRGIVKHNLEIIKELKEDS